MIGAALPQIGIRLSGGIVPRLSLELAQAAEAAGFASVWFAENPFQRGAIATAGACAAATQRVRIGIGVVNPFSRHPTLIAMEAAALDELCEGRVVLGIGSGIGSAVRRMGGANDRAITAVREAIAIVRAMLSGDMVTYRAKVFCVEDVKLGFRPQRRDLPVFMAGAGDRALRTCGEIADGLIVSNLTPPNSTERMAPILAEAAARAGRTMPRIVQYVPCVARPDRDAARRAAKSAIGEMLIDFWPAGDDWPPARQALAAESGIGRHDLGAALARLRRGDDAASALDERFVEAFAIAGTAADCLHQAARYRKAGVDELALSFAGTQPAADIAYFGRAFATASRSGV
jgi:5,10-methylenetetrahydromethanopterin reductase